jgi:hypothetical protein
MRLGSKHTPEMRAALGQKMRAVHASPEAREFISRRTKEGLQNAPGVSRELRALRAYWKLAEPAVRKRFIQEIFDAAFEPRRRR